MFNDLQLFGLGAAAVIDTVLLMALIERPNRRQVAIWMIVLTAAAWLWHSGSFVHTLLAAVTHSWPLRVNALSMTAMSIGVLLMPSSMLHGAIRLWHTGVEAKPRSDARYWLCYLPLFALGPMARSLFADPGGEYLTLVAPFTTPFVFWLCATNLIAAVTFWGLLRRVALPQAAAFFRGMAAMLCSLSVLVVFVVFVAVPQWPEQAEAWKFVASLSPVLPALLFAYHVVRFGFVPLVLERTLVYGAVLAAAFLFHHLALADVTNRLSEQMSVDFAIVEAVAVAALIVSYQPLRQRVAEALRYLLGSRVSGVREQTRQLAARMSEGIEQPIELWLTSIIAEVRMLFGVDHAGCWIFGDGERIVGAATSGQSLRTCLRTKPAISRNALASGSEGQTTIEPDASAFRLIGSEHGFALRQVLSSEQAVVMQRLVRESGQRVLTRFVANDPTAQSLLTSTGTSAAIAFDHRDLRGLLVLGRKPFNQELADEELSSLTLLTEQLAVTLRNARLQQDRLTAERRALRQEKLSTLGLLASSIAHEIKNPLSSIRTISTVMAEDLGSDSPHAEDLRLIISEIDRLAATTRQLLEFARPAPATDGSCVPRDLLERTLRILKHLAQQKGVRLETVFDHEPPAVPIAVRADSESLSEVFFNLISNSIDAAGTGGLVSISCRHEITAVVVQIRDTGTGLPPEVQDHLFEPFVTTKLDGTGLGLYIVGRRIRELGAEIRCESTRGEGTSFEVRLPTWSAPA